jgi:uncharacterized protein (DUF779 family)
VVKVRERIKPLPFVIVLVASLQTAFSLFFLVAPSGTCCSGLDARGRREPLSSDLVASLQPPLSVILLVASSGSCGIGLDARGRREPLSSDLVASLQPAFGAILLVASSGSCCIGLDARGRREPLSSDLAASLQPPLVQFSWLPRQAPVASGSTRVDGASPCRAILPLRCTENKRDSGRRQKLKPLMIVHANCWWILFLLSHEFRVKQFTGFGSQTARPSRNKAAVRTRSWMS